VRSLTVTGIPTSQQTVYFEDLSDINGIKLPSQFSSAPLIKVFGCTRPQDFYISEPAVNYFKIARYRAGVIDISTPLTVSLEIVAIGITTQLLGMTILEMVGAMKILLGGRFNNTQLLMMLNTAQDALIKKFYPREQLLRELDVEVTDLVLDENGAFDLSSLDNPIYMGANGLRAVKFQDAIKNCSYISDEEYKIYQNRSHVYATDDPVYRVFGNKIYLLPFYDDEIESGDIEEDADYYVGGYTTLVYNSVTYTDGDTFTGVSGATDYTTTGSGTVVKAQYFDLRYTKKAAKMTIEDSSADNINCELSEEKQNILIGFSLKDWIDLTPQALRSYQNAMIDLEEMLNTYPMTETMEKTAVNRKTDGYASDEYGIPTDGPMRQYIP